MGFINSLFGKNNTRNIQTELYNSKKGYTLHDLNIVARQIELICDRISEFKEPLIHELNEERKSYNVVNENNKDRLENLKKIELISKQIAKLKRNLEVKGETHSEEYALYDELTREISNLIERKNLMYILMRTEGELTALEILKNKKSPSKLIKLENYLKQLKYLVEKSYKKGDFEKEFEKTEKDVIETTNRFYQEIKTYQQKVELNLNNVLTFMNSGKGQALNQINEIVKIMRKHKTLILNNGSKKLMGELIRALKNNFMSDVKKNIWVQIDQLAEKNYNNEQFNELNRMFATINGIKIAYMNFLKYRYEEYDKNLRAKNPKLANFLNQKFQH